MSDESEKQTTDQSDEDSASQLNEKPASPRDPVRRYTRILLGVVAVPEMHFFLVLWLVTMLIFASFIFSDLPLSKYMGSAAIAMTILVSWSLSPEADFVGKMLIRVILICGAALYVAAALAFIDRYLFRTREQA